MSVFSYLEVEAETVPFIINEAVTEYENRIYKELSKTYARYFTLREANRILNMHLQHPQEKDELAIYDNRASFKMKIEKVQQTYCMEPNVIAQSRQRTLSSFDDRISKKSMVQFNRSRIFSTTRQSDMSKSPTKRKLVIKTQHYHFIPLEQEQSSEKDLDSLVFEEQMRAKKHVQMLKEQKYKKDMMEKGKNKVGETEQQKKLLKELQKKSYTYDYDGQVIFRKKNNQNYNLYKEVTAKFEAPKKESQKEMEVAYINQSRQEQSVLPTQNEDRLSRQTFNPNPDEKQAKAQNDLYNNNDKRQVSHLPYIKLQEGVTIREYSKGKEEVHYSSGNDHKLQKISKKEYLELSEEHNTQLLETFLKHHNIQKQNTLLEMMKTQTVLEDQANDVNQSSHHLKPKDQEEKEKENEKEKEKEKEIEKKKNIKQRNRSQQEYQQESEKEVDRMNEISKTLKVEVNFRMQERSGKVESMEQNYRLPVIPMMKKQNQNHQQMRRLNKHSSRMSNLSEWTSMNLQTYGSERKAKFESREQSSDIINVSTDRETLKKYLDLE